VERTDAGLFRVQDSPIQVKVGQTFTLALVIRAATGFVWSPIFAPSDLVLQRDTFEVPQGPIGGGGCQLLTFEAVRAGRFQIRLELRRSWEDRVLQTEGVDVIATQRPQQHRQGRGVDHDR